MSDIEPYPSLTVYGSTGRWRCSCGATGQTESKLVVDAIAAVSAHEDAVHKPVRT